jgi:hypothetical protein
MDWRCGSSDSTPALQAQSPEFKTPVPSKNKQRYCTCKQEGQTQGSVLLWSSATHAKEPSLGGSSPMTPAEAAALLSPWLVLTEFTPVSVIP